MITILTGVVVVLFLLSVVVGAHQLRSRRKSRWTSSSSCSPQSVTVDEKTPLLHNNLNRDQLQQQENEKTNENGGRIVPLPNFDWKTTEPLKFRPFKPKYHITMALQNSTPSDLIIIDSNYLSRIHYRQHILSLHKSEVIGCLPEGEKPVKELYIYLLRDYLPVRYPTMFRLVPAPLGSSGTGGETAMVFENLVTGDLFEVWPVPEDPLECLRRIAVTVEDDFYLLLPFPVSSSSSTSPPVPNSPSTPNDPPMPMEHRAVAFLNIHPSGFLPRSKLSLPLSAIHAPVPSYSKIGPSLERFFSRLCVNTLTKRVNWSIQLHSELYSPSGNHVHEDEVNTLKEVEEFGDEEGEEARLRVELQVVWKLKGGAKVFGFKTYLYGLKEVKEEVVEVEGEGEDGADGEGGGKKKVKMGEELARAIEGLGEGNAPGMWRYKGAVRWGRAVTEWLRS